MPDFERPSHREPITFLNTCFLHLYEEIFLCLKNNFNQIFPVKKIEFMFIRFSNWKNRSSIIHIGNFSKKVNFSVGRIFQPIKIDITRKSVKMFKKEGEKVEIIQFKEINLLITNNSFMFNEKIENEFSTVRELFREF